MKHILGLLLTLNAWAIASGDKATFANKYQDGANPSFVNYIKNPSCLRNAVNVTGTNTTPSRNTTTPLTSIADCQSTLDSATDTIDLGTATLDRSLKNGNCEVSMNYKLTLGSGNTIQLQARINSATVASADLVTSDNGTATVNFPCGDLSNAPSIRIAQTAGSSSQAINWSNAYLGAARNVGSVSQASVIGTAVHPNASSCVWTSTSTSKGTFSADTDCTTPTVTGSASAPSTKVPGITFTNLAPGNYEVSFSGNLQTATNGCVFSVYDGTSYYGEAYDYAPTSLSNGHTKSVIIPYNTAQTNITFQVGVKAESGATCSINNSTGGVYGSAGDIQLRFEVKRFPSSSEIAVRNGQQFPISTLNYTGTTNCNWNNTSTGSWADFTADTDCPTQTVTGQATAPGTKIPAIVINSMPAGTYLLQAQGAFLSGTTSTCSWRFTDGTNSTSPITGGYDTVYAGDLNGIYTNTSVGDRTIKIQYYGADSGNCQIVATTANRDLKINVIPISQAIPSPILVGSVTSSSTGAERVERAKVNCDASSSIISQSGSWLSAIGNRSTTACSITIASGIFSAEPTCVFTIEAGTVQATSVDMTSATAGTIYGASADYDGNLICMGPR